MSASIELDMQRDIERAGEKLATKLGITVEEALLRLADFAERQEKVEELVAIDLRVDAAEGEGIRERWIFGRQLRTERIGKKLPAGLLDDLVEKTGKSREELQCRVRFSERFPTEESLCNAVTQYGSWHAIVNQALASTAHLSNNKDEWETPQWLFDILDAEFGFELDVCASARNAKCEDYFTIEDDALACEWRGVCWMNPPYSEIDEWMEKALESSKDGATVVCLVPARTDVGWFWDYARHGEVRLVRGRLHFVDDEGNTGPAPFPSCVVIFGSSSSGVMFWEVTKSE